MAILPSPLRTDRVPQDQGVPRAIFLLHLVFLLVSRRPRLSRGQVAHWCFVSSITRVTESGDTLTFDPAVATTAPLSQTPFAVVTYAVHITGGTGKFAGAIGDIKNNGEVALAGQATVFRYPGQVCFTDQD